MNHRSDPVRAAAHTLTLTDPDAIAHYRRCVLRAALKLEIAGLRRSRAPSAYAQIKREFALHGTRESVLAQFTAYIEAHRPVCRATQESH